MTGHEAMYLLRKVAEDLNVPFGEIQFRKYTSIYECDTNKRDGQLIFRIGVREFVNHPSDDFSTTDVMYPLVGLFHEVCGHGGQQYYEFQKTTALSKVLALNHYARNASWSYYGFHDGKINEQYFKQPHEIAAQYAGIYCAYEFLCDKYPTNEANDMICRYVNERVRLGSEFGLRGREYVSVDTILHDMDESFQQSVFKHWEYEHLERNPDMLVQLSRMQENPDIVAKVENCKNGLRQDFMMAAVYVRFMDKDYTIQNQPACQSIHFYKAFRALSQPIRPKPRTEELSLSDLTNTRRPDLKLSTADLGFANEQWAEIHPH